MNDYPANSAIRKLSLIHIFARDGSISAQTIASLRRLKEKGIRLFLATGRHTTELEEPLSRMRIDFDGYVTLNGQLTLDASFQVIDEAPIDAQDAACLLYTSRCV